MNTAGEQAEAGAAAGAVGDFWAGLTHAPPRLRVVAALEALAHALLVCQPAEELHRGGPEGSCSGVHRQLTRRTA